MSRFSLLPGCLVILSLVACGQDEPDTTDTSPANSAATGESANANEAISNEAGHEPLHANEALPRQVGRSAPSSHIIHLRDDAEIEFAGKTTSQPDALPKLVAQELGVLDQGELLAAELIIAVEEPWPVGGLHEIVLGLQRQGFQNLTLESKGEQARLPKPYGLSSDSQRFAQLELMPAEDKTSWSIEITANEKVETIEGLATPSPGQPLPAELKVWLTKAAIDQSTQPRTTDVELTAPPTSSAQAFTAVFVSMSKLNEAEALDLQFWPFGYPREGLEPGLELNESLEIVPLDSEDLDLDGPQKELKEFDIDR